MDCHAIGFSRGSLDKTVPWLSWVPVKSGIIGLSPVQYNISTANARSASHKLRHHRSSERHPESLKLRRRHSLSVHMEEQLPLAASDDHHEDAENGDGDSPEEALSRPLSSRHLKTMLADSERTKLVRKLSEANQQNRFLKRESLMDTLWSQGYGVAPSYPPCTLPMFKWAEYWLLSKENTLANFKGDLAVLELEVQALVVIAEEITKCGVPKGSRRINGRYIQSHLLSRLEAVRDKLKEHTKNVEAVQAKEVPLLWVGMAESVQVMGSFNGWSEGEYLSPEYTGSFAQFSTTLMLRPGRYEIKFLVDGDWRLSPEFPTVGEGMTQNNLLIVE